MGGAVCMKDAWSGVLGGDAGSSPPRPLPLNSEEPTIPSRSCHTSALPLTLCDFRSSGVSSLGNGDPLPPWSVLALGEVPTGRPLALQGPVPPALASSSRSVLIPSDITDSPPGTSEAKCEDLHFTFKKAFPTELPSYGKGEKEKSVA